MKELLTATVLATLSVSKLEEELKLGYPKDTLVEALENELAKEEPRKTAIEALENELARYEEEKEEVSFVIAKGKSITTLAGIKTENEKIEEKHFKTKEIFYNLVEKNFIVKA